MSSGLRIVNVVRYSTRPRAFLGARSMSVMTAFLGSRGSISPTAMPLMSSYGPTAPKDRPSKIGVRAEIVIRTTSADSGGGMKTTQPNATEHKVRALIDLSWLSPARRRAATCPPRRILRQFALEPRDFSEVMVVMLGHERHQIDGPHRLSKAWVERRPLDQGLVEAIEAVNQAGPDPPELCKDPPRGRRIVVGFVS